MTRFCLALLTVLVALGSTAQGSILTPFTDRTAFAGDDFIDWGILGPTEQQIANPFTIDSNSGVEVTVAKTTGNFQRRDQGNGWNGSFADGDALLWTFGATGPMTFTFDVLVAGFGFQINNNVGTPLDAAITVFGANGVNFGTLNFAINALDAPTASFIGVRSDLNDIQQIVVSTSVNEFAINRADLVTSPQEPVSVPEPSTIPELTFLGIGLLVLSLTRSRPRVGV